VSKHSNDPGYKALIVLRDWLQRELDKAMQKLEKYK